MRNAISHRSRQKGAALLAMVIVFIMASSYAFITKLNANTRDYSRRSSSLPILNEAKAALIGYAVNYPLDHAGRGPGHLPCADIDNDGTADAPCALAGPVNFTYGRFPWASLFLKTGDLRDASGETLWYAVADNYRSNVAIGPNSDTAGNFSVDGNNDIVAVIFAPGSPLAGQDRSGGPLNIANYLEDDNANGDVNFVTRSANDFNDTLVTITRQELMAVVEKRVLGDVDETLINYQNNYNAYPWLSAFGDPSNSAYRGTVNTVEGHLPFHWALDPDSNLQGGTAIDRNPFPTNVGVTWDNIINANITVSNFFGGFGITTLSAACLNDINDCDEGGIFPEITSLSPPANINCTWSDKDTVNCDSFSVSTTVNYRPDVSCPISTITRTYTINYPAYTGVSVVVNPTATNTRRRDVSLTAAGADFIPAQANAISISDVYNNTYLYWFGSCFGPFGTITVASGASTFDADTQGIIAVNDIRYDIDIDAGELPSWFVQNGWHELIYLAYASGETLPGDTIVGQDCNTLATPCVSVTINGTLTPNVRAAVFSAGLDLSPLTARPNGILSDYFEVENSSPADDTFLKDKTTAIYNDQTRIISTAP